MTNIVPAAWARARALVPYGQQLPQAMWEARHRFIVWTAAAHAPALALFGWWRGWAAGLVLLEVAVIALLAWMAAIPQFTRRMRGALSGLALVTSSAVLVQFAGGVIEAHFHYFVVVALVALYEDYVPFLLAIAYVALDHGVVGSLAPEYVYNHADAAGKPWKWAAIHAAAILAESVALLGFWAGAQQVRARSDVVLDSTGEGILGTNLEHRVTFANPAAARILGHPEAELIGRPLEDVLPDVLRPGRSQGSGIFVTRLQRAQGDVLLEWSVNATRRNGVVLGSVVAIRDITDRRKLEDQVVAQARQNAAIARLGQFALEAHDLDVLLEESVAAVSSTLGTDLSKVLELDPGGATLRLRAGVGWRAGLVGQGRVSAGLESQAGYTLSSNGPVIVADLRTETRFRGPPLLHDHGVVSGMSVVITAGRQPWGVLGTHTTRPRPFTADEVNFLQAVAHLIASAVERNQVEQELRAHRQDLEGLVAQRTAELTDANRELEAFSYTVSHDLRSPLRGIDGFSRLLQVRYGDTLPPEAHELLGRVQDSALRMGNLIESVLTLSRINRTAMQVAPVDLGALATGILQDLERAEPDRRVDWHVEPGLHAQGDEGLLRIVLENLIANAWKFTARTAAPKVRVGRGPDGAGSFVVEDNGAGFDMAHAGELFQPFHRLHEATAFPGTGIGLATVSRILQRHGGTVRAESAPGKGARFVFTLPADATGSSAPGDGGPRPLVHMV